MENIRDRFQKFIDANPYFKEFNNDKDSYKDVYHYTDLKAVKNIVENNCFWLTKANFLNDFEEVTYAAELIERLLKSGRYSNDLINLLSQYTKSIKMVTY